MLHTLPASSSHITKINTFGILSTFRPCQKAEICQVLGNRRFKAPQDCIVLATNHFVSDTSTLTLRATCDNHMTLYVDGAEIQPTTGELMDWTSEKIFLIGQSFETLAIKCVDVGSQEGTLASVEDGSGETILLTDDSWKCSDREQPGWTAAEFYEDPEVWKSAIEIGAHVVEPWGVIGSISRNAKWIWYQDQAQDTSFCRFTRPKSTNLLMNSITNCLNPAGPA